MAVLKDIAKKAGVSISTVSRALQNDARISQATRLKIEAVANAMGYTKHKAKKDKNQVWDAAGLILPEVSSGYYAQLVHLANDYFERHQLSTIIKITNFEKEAMIRHILSFSRYDVKCLLIIVDDSEEISEDIFNAVSHIKVPVLFITAKYISNLDYDSLYIDEQRGVAMALEYLIEKGYKRIGFIGEEKTLGRYHVYKKVMQDFEMPVDKRYVKICKERAEEGGYYCMKEILKQKANPDAIFASYDHMAIGAIYAIEEAGLSIPEDIAIMGFDDIFISRYINKGLTSIQNPYEDMISIAVRILLKRIEQPHSAPQQVALKPSLIIRGTT